jgi:voltage-gated potassium channel
MFSGVTAIGIISAKVSAYFLREVLLEGRGIVDRSKIANHFIVCGWKPDMAHLIGHIMLLNRSLKPDQIVIVTNTSQADIAALRADPKLAGIVVIYGDYFQQATLERAAPEKARKILILADGSHDAEGRRPSATEADARTIMTAIALSNIAKGTVVAAEIIDPSLDHYLKMAGVGEIIYSREYSRLLLGSAAGGHGLVNVFHDLVDPRTGASVTTYYIGQRWIGQTYKEFRTYFEERHPDTLVIGILENTGNPYAIKDLAFQEAQKTSSVGRLIENLKAVKSLRCNQPVFHPRGDYRILKGSSAIVLVNEHATQTNQSNDDDQEMDTVAA